MRRTLSGLLLSSMFLTAAAYASPASDDVSASTLPVSTGVIPPRALNTLNITRPSGFTGYPTPVNSMITVTFTVNEAGEPRDIQIVKGANPYWNSSVAHAVQNLRYQPATMNHLAIPVVVKLNVNLTQ